MGFEFDLHRYFICYVPETGVVVRFVMWDLRQDVGLHRCRQKQWMRRVPTTELT